jgi:hypothetical protein
MIEFIDEVTKVKGDITHILYAEQIKHIKSTGKWYALRARLILVAMFRLCTFLVCPMTPARASVRERLQVVAAAG